MLEKATLGAGCFWGVEESLGQMLGVVSTRVGYTGGSFKNPTYADVCKGESDHVEAVEVTFDASVLNYTDLLEKFWSLHDGSAGFYKRQYQSVIFTHSNLQELEAKSFLASLKIYSSKEISIVVEPLNEFYPAEERHQHYVQKRNDPHSARSNR